MLVYLAEPFIEWDALLDYFWSWLQLNLVCVNARWDALASL